MPHIELRCEWHFGNCSIWIMRDQCRFIKREDHRSKHISFSVRNWKDKKCLRPQRTKAKKNIKKSEKALSQADFPENPVISFSVLRATSGVLTAFEKLKEHPLSLCWCLASGFFARVYLRTAETSICQVPYYACWFSFGCVWYAENGFFRPRFADWYKIILDDEICHALTYNTSWPDWTAHYALRHCGGHTT